MERRVVSLVDWQREGVELFGKDPNDWRFRCPACGHVQTRQDLLDLKIDRLLIDSIVGYSCVGRWRRSRRLDPLVVDYGDMDQGSGCTYKGGNPWNFSPVAVEYAPGQFRPTFEWSTT